MSEVDPDPYEPGEGQGESELGGREAPASGDPTDGGRSGEIGDDPEHRRRRARRHAGPATPSAVARSTEERTHLRSPTPARMPDRS